MNAIRRGEPRTPVLHYDTEARALRAALWLAILQADRLRWADVSDALFPLHALVAGRIHEADIGQWRQRLAIEGPNQPPDDFDDPCA